LLLKGCSGMECSKSPLGVRSAKLVPPDECKRCIMAYLDHSLGGLFSDDNVCLKDIAGVKLPPKLRRALTLELHTIFPNIKIAEMMRISRERVRQILVEAGVPSKRRKGSGRCIVCGKPISRRNLYCSECLSEHRKQVYKEREAQPERKNYRRNYFLKRYADPEYRKQHLAQHAEYMRRRKANEKSYQE